MRFSIGIIGFPNAGKSTLFKALTKKEVRIEPRPFSTVEPNVGVVSLPDERLARIASTVKPEKTTPTTIEFWDIAGLVKGAHKGRGLGNKFLTEIRNCDALLEIIRAFKSKKVPHPEEAVDPDRDLEIIKTELLMKDLETVERALKNMGRENPEKKALLEKIKEGLEKEKGLSKINLSPEQRGLIKEFQFLTQKPRIFILNTGQKNESIKREAQPVLKINLSIEEEITGLSPEELEELGFSSRLPWLISACYQKLGLITFYTIAGGEEARAWTLKKGKTAAEAGGEVHSDFEKEFIRAEVINWKKLTQTGSWKQAKQKGLVQTVGRDYTVKDGDVIEFKI